jgi:hypothetical protein
MELEKRNNLELWGKVEKTNPKYTKKAKVGGLPITSIAPQYQIMNATEQFGSYGEKWGFRNIQFDFSITNIPTILKVVDWTTKKEEEIISILGLVAFKATFFFPNGEFEITNSIKIFTDNKHSKIDDNFAKKLETDALTKALSKLGFNADIFMGKFDDVRYVEEMNEEFDPAIKAQREAEAKALEVAARESFQRIERNTIRIEACSTVEELSQTFKEFSKDEQKEMSKITTKRKNILAEPIKEEA